MMEKLLDSLKREYDLTLGNKTFSPIMQISIGLAMKYHEEVENGFDMPFHLNFPDKLDAALWLSVAQLRNYLLEDYINQPSDMVSELNLKVGDKVEIFGATAIFKGIESNKLKLGFNKQTTPIELDITLTKYLNHTTKRVNKYSVFGRNWKERKQNRNAISKLLEPKNPIYIDENIFNSKVLVISGRGNTGKFMNRLKDECIYGSPLSDVFLSGKNLIIKPDLEDFTFLGKNEAPIIEERFKNIFLRFIDELNEELPDRKIDIDSLVENIKENDFRTKEFKNLFDEIVSECNPESKYHLIKDKYYPGVKEHLPEHLKSVVINDINQLEVYSGVVKEFIKKGIPVLVISNRYIEDKRALSFFKNYFKTHSEDLRISWGKNKIKQISKLSLKEENYLDYNLWKKCLKFSKQKIKIETTAPHSIDDILMDVQKAITSLEGQERLRNAYWRYFNPLMYSFKNSSVYESYHDDLLKEFLSVFEEVKITLTQDLRLVINEIIDELKANKESFKSFDDKGFLFGQYIDFEYNSVIFPRGDYTYITSENINSSKSQITFTGFPLNEPLYNYLLDSINEHIIQDINIVCWPKEGRFTYHYILNRLKAGYYLDNIPDIWNIPDGFLLNYETDILDEIHERLLFDLDSHSDVEENKIEAEEEVLRKISTFKYSAYQSSITSDSNAKVSCNIIDLEGNKFMFLPKTSSVMAKIETEGDMYQIKRAKFNDLKPGDEIFQYELSRHRLRELSKNADYKNNIFSKLELWKDSLKKSFLEESCDLQKLLERLNKVNLEYNLDASPTYQNLRNWLFDDVMLSPEKQNLHMILHADSDTEMINELSFIYDAYKKARSLSRTVSTEIKNLIIRKLKSMNLSEISDFEILVFGSPLEIEFRKIKRLQKADFEVDYQDTRKFKGP